MNPEHFRLYQTADYLQSVSAMGFESSDPQNRQNSFVIVEGSITYPDDPVSILYATDESIAREVAARLGAEHVWTYPELVGEATNRLLYFGDYVSQEEWDLLHRDVFRYGHNCNIAWMREWMDRMGNEEIVMYFDGQLYFFGIKRYFSDVIPVVKNMPQAEWVESFKSPNAA